MSIESVIPPNRLILCRPFSYHLRVFLASSTFQIPFWRVSLVAQLVKNLPAMQETQVPLLGQEDPQEKGMATGSSILA